MLFIAGGAFLVAAIAAGVLIFTSARPASSPAAVTPVVTQVALPDFADVAENNATENSPPDLATPTPGIAGPTAVVVTNSPWQVIVAPRAVADLQSPTGVAVDNDGNFYVVDFQNNFVQKFSAGGQPLARFGQKGSGPGQFSGPLDVAVDGAGNLYIADANNQRIQKLSPTGQPLAAWGSGGDGAGQFWLPSGVAVDAAGQVYVADRGNHRIQVLSASGQPVSQFGGRGPEPGHFWSPSDVTIGPDGRVYVADSSNQRVQVLTATGQPLAQWGWEGSDPGLFSLPSAVAVDATGNVYVSDSRNSRVQKLSSTGQPLAAWGVVVGQGTPRPAPEPGTFVAPGGLAVDKQGTLYVADTRNLRIQKLSQ